ncbi:MULTISPECIES: TonB-dependent receptor [Flavobacterium]|uniref:TonB-dependent receptor n=1 Tax=Flavobacterium hankyongi TaxID=1176532 RepID=A0ABP8ZUP8_9FLAO|nr:TonB-dependent receptor [Flavobacterium sp. N1846]
MKKIFLALMVLGQMSYGQNKKTDSLCVKLLDDVVITSNRTLTRKTETPVSITKLSEKQISETKAAAVYEIVNKTPGVLMTNLGNEQHMMAIRQPMTTNSYYLYLEDGLPIRPMGVFNHNALLEINQFNLQNIEVVKGPVSSLYGPEAVGGAVNLISKKPSDRNQIKIGYQADQWGYHRFQTMASGTVGKFGFHMAGLTSLQRNSWMTFSDYDKNNINARLDYTFSANDKIVATVFYGKYYSDMSGTVNENDFNNRSYKSQTDFTYRKSDALRTKLMYEHCWGQDKATSVTAFLRDNKLGQNPSYAIKWKPGESTATGEINSNNFKSYGLLVQHNQKFDFLNTTLVAGGLFDRSPIDYWAYQIDLKANLNPGGQTVNYYELLAERPDIKLSEYNGTIYNYAGFTQVSVKPIEKLVVTVGGRFDQMNIDYNNTLANSSGKKDFGQFTFKAGTNYNPFKTAGFYANYAQGFAPPGVTSIFRLKPGTGGTTGVPAEFYYNLKEATFNNYEVGGWLSFFDRKWNFEYALYYMDGENELLNIRQPDNSFDYRSAGKTRHKGVEFAVNYKPSQQFNLRVGGTAAQHTFIDFEISEKASDPVKNLNGKEMPSAPKWVGNSEVSYYPKWLPNFRIAAEWQYVSSWYQDQVNMVKYEGYNVFNGRVAYKIKGIEAYLNVMNFTNKLYAYNVTRGNTSTSQPTYTAAAPRTFVFGLQYDLTL